MDKTAKYYLLKWEECKQDLKAMTASRDTLKEIIDTALQRRDGGSMHEVMIERMDRNIAGVQDDYERSNNKEEI